MRWKLAVAWVIAQLVFFAGWAAVEGRRHTNGTVILVRTAPVDPRDLLSGQYMALSYEFSGMSGRFDSTKPPAEGDEVWMVLRKEGDFHVVDHAEAYEPDRLPRGQVAIRGRRDRWRLVYGIEKYFVPEGTETPAQRDVTVRLRVGPDGTVRIEQVLVKGNPWP